MVNAPNSYSKTQWVNDVTKLNATNMNKIEQELSDTKESVIDNANSINEILAALNDYTSIRFSNGVLTLSIGNPSETPALTKTSSTNIDLSPYATYENMNAELDKRIAKAMLTAKGDMIYASGNAEPAKLSIGEPGQVLSVDASGVPKWQTPILTNSNVINSGTGVVTSVSISEGSLRTTKGKLLEIIDNGGQPTVETGGFYFERN